jgi:hypothetical protein
MYEDFRILIDDPASKLSLGFDDYAGALAEIARLSRPQFAIGIFGAWGSGKTTLMRAMESTLAADPSIVPVWFNAWRYEKEEHLIVPLLDTIRDQVLEWGDDAQPTETRERVRGLARALGRAAKAILSGLTLKAGVPGAVDLSLDANKVATEWRRDAEVTEEANQPRSFYHATFLALRSAVTEFVSPDGPGAQRRFVVFIDDLDRCLPEKALEVLESMKLFFDLEGFVFVVGLDQRVIERAVQLKYPLPPPEGSAGPETYIGGAEYVKKIFQVQFTAPRIDRSQLEDFLAAIAEGELLPPAQREDLKLHVAPQIPNLASSTSVNPREVKRLVNAYTMQMKILERKLRDVGQTPSAPAVLALQIMSFRADWRETYDALSNNPTEFLDGLNDALANGGTRIAVDQSVLELPVSFLSYVREDGRALLDAGSQLELYVSSLEAARSTDPIGRDLAQTLGRIRVAQSSNDPQASAQVRDLLSELHERLQSFSYLEGTNTRDDVRTLLGAYPTDPSDSELLRDWMTKVGAALPVLTQRVADVRRRTATAASNVA